VNTSASETSLTETATMLDKLIKKIEQHIQRLGLMEEEKRIEY
jgi:hypothetical protein